MKRTTTRQKRTTIMRKTDRSSATLLILLVPCALLMISCRSAAHFPEEDLADRLDALRAEAPEGTVPEAYLSAYRQGYLRSSRSQSGYLGRIVIGGQPQKHPLQLAYEQGTRDAGADRVWKWTAPRRIDYRDPRQAAAYARRANARGGSRWRR